jgi:hypothetical protein
MTFRNVQDFAKELCSVQPMQGPVGEIFTMKFKVTPAPKYNFSRAKWYTVAIGSNRIRPEMNEWCVNQFGHATMVPDAWSRWHCSWCTFYFRDEKDYMLFILRWA